jgi:hypothetical protein
MKRVVLSLAIFAAMIALFDIPADVGNLFAVRREPLAAAPSRHSFGGAFGFLPQNACRPENSQGQL